MEDITPGRSCVRAMALAKNGDIIDVTAGQFKTPVSYHGGSKRVRTKGRRLVMMREDDVPNDMAKKLLERIKSGK